MTPQQKLKHLILLNMTEIGEKDLPTITANNVDELFEMYDTTDTKNDLRSGQVETNLPCEYNRNYEAKSVAAQTPYGSWVGWTYWYGGGKHSDPESIDWMSEAYDLTCLEEEKLVVVRTFTKIET